MIEEAPIYIYIVTFACAVDTTFSSSDGDRLRIVKIYYYNIPFDVMKKLFSKSLVIP